MTHRWTGVWRPACWKRSGWKSWWRRMVAMRWIRSNKSEPDLVVTDMQMPEMDGLALVQQVTDIYPAIPVILMTAFGSEELAVKACRLVRRVTFPNRTWPATWSAPSKNVLAVARARHATRAMLGSMTQARIRLRPEQYAGRARCADRSREGSTAADAIVRRARHPANRHRVVRIAGERRSSMAIWNCDRSSESCRIRNIGGCSRNGAFGLPFAIGTST